MTTRQPDVVVIGAGIAGLAQAWAASKNGRSVTVIERSPHARGASIRNFGMIWPIGQPAGVAFETALRSRELWVRAAEQAGFWHAAEGSIYLATRPDELAVMREFVEDHAGQLGYECEMLTQQQAWERCPAANRQHVIGGFLSRTEVGVDPREALAKLPTMLRERHGVDFRFDTHASQCRTGEVVLSDGSVVQASEQIVVCSGSETKMLFPGLLEQAGAVPCQLQMLSTAPQPHGWRIGPMIASGSTLRHYESFRVCRSLAALKRRFAEQTPELDDYGIHLMAAQNGLGEIIMGDSHAYGSDITPFNVERIDRMMLAGLKELLDLKDFTVARRWQGVYLKVPGQSHLELEPLPGVTVFNGLGGAGMTLSFGLADAMWSGRRGTGEPLQADPRES